MDCSFFSVCITPALLLQALNWHVASGSANVTLTSSSKFPLAEFCYFRAGLPRGVVLSSNNPTVMFCTVIWSPGQNDVLLTCSIYRLLTEQKYCRDYCPWWSLPLQKLDLKKKKMAESLYFRPHFSLVNKLC